MDVAHIESPVQTQASETRRFLMFEVGNRQLAIPVEVVAEILPMASLSGRPEGSSILAGFLNLEGSVVPVLQTARLIDAPDIVIHAFTSIVIARHESERIGLLVDHVQQIFAASPVDIFVLPSRSFFTNALKLNEKIVPIVAIAELVFIEEQKRIGDMRKIQQRRLEAIEQACV